MKFKILPPSKKTTQTTKPGDFFTFITDHEYLYMVVSHDKKLPPGEIEVVVLETGSVVTQPGWVGHIPLKNLTPLKQISEAEFETA